MPYLITSPNGTTYYETLTEDELEVFSERGRTIKEVIIADEVMELALCEISRVMLRPGQLYRFLPMAGCDQCEKLAQEYQQAHKRLTQWLN